MGCRAEACRGEVGRVKKRICGTRVSVYAGCSQSPSSKAAADGSTGGVAPGYVEDAFEGRTKLAGFWGSLLVLGFAGVQIPVLPVEPGMAQFVG
jgi:hypothetical protein